MSTQASVPSPRAARVTRAAAAAVVAVAALAAGTHAATATAGTAADGAHAPKPFREHGDPVALGQGHARAYVVRDSAAGGRTVEIGVALDERAMEGLPAHGAIEGAHGHYSEYLLPLPAGHATPFTFVELDWNPAGHGGPYVAPHFDFHFYTIPVAQRNAIEPSDPQFLAKAARDPEPASLPPSYRTLMALFTAPIEAMVVPRMGMHWLDERTPEVQQALGKPEAHRPFTKTFIYGAWDGQFIFMEPMITRDYIVAKKAATDPAVRDEWVPISTSPTYPAGAFRPNGYRVTYDAQAREYRIALVTMPGGA